MFSWQDTFKKPFFILAPMEDVTDTVFRQVILECGRPDVFFTEFTSTDGICSIGKDKVIHRLKYDKIEKPLIAQIWGKTPQHYHDTANLCLKLGFDGVDINMGCPDKTVIQNGCCSALIKNQPLAKEIIEATKEGLEGKIPISVKTRIGFNTIATEEWIPFLLQQNLDALIIHGRTVKDLSNVPNRWEEIAKAVKIRDELQANLSQKTPIIANGDVFSLDDGYEKIKQYKVDGIMMGRAIFQNPWLFNPDIKLNQNQELVNLKTSQIMGKKERLQVLVRHLDLWQKTWQDQKNPAIIKKFYKMYAQLFTNAAAFRQKLMEAESLDIAKQMVLEEILVEEN